MVPALRPALLVHVLCRKAHKAGLAFAAPPDGMPAYIPPGVRIPVVHRTGKTARPASPSAWQNKTYRGHSTGMVL